MKQDALISRQSIKKIFSSYHLPQPTLLREIKTGLTNPVFVADEKFVLRIDTSHSEKDPNKFEKEAFLYTLLAKFDIPVPKLIVFDNSKKIIDYEFLLLSYIEGETLEQSFPLQSTQDQTSLCSQLGELAHKIHSVPLSALAAREKLLRKEKNWSETVRDEHLEYFSLVVEKDYLPAQTVTMITDTFKQFSQLKMPRGNESLVHGDFSPSNIQVKNGQIVGIFDFEFATLGDPFYDLQKIPAQFQLGENFDTNLFWKGYEKSDLNSEEKLRLQMYCLNQGLWEIWATETQRFPFGEKQIAEGQELIRIALEL